MTYYYSSKKCLIGEAPIKVLHLRLHLYHNPVIHKELSHIIMWAHWIYGIDPK